MGRLVTRLRRVPKAVRAGSVALSVLVPAVLSCSNDSLDPDRAAVASVVVTPSRLNVGVGASAPITVELRDATGSLLHDRKVAWASKDPSIAAVSGAGVVTGVAPGEVQVVATAERRSALATVTVNPKGVASIRLTPSGDQALLVGQTRQMTAETLDSDGNPLPGRQVTWSSSSTAIASVSATGLITAIAAGGTVVTAASEGRTAIVAVTVSTVPIATISVTPATDTVVVTQTVQLTAVAKDAQGGTLTGRTMAWITSDAARATVSSTGLVTAVSPGAATITASAEGKSGTASITIKEKPVASVTLSPAQVSIETGQTRQFTAQVTDDQGNVLTGRAVTFSSENATIATVSASGVVTGLVPGSTKITATSEGKSGSADVTVTPVPVATVAVTPTTSTIVIGQTVTLVATARDANGIVLPGRAVTWTNGAPSIVTVSALGVVTALSVGTGVVIATVEGRTGQATVNVRQVSSVSVTGPTTVFVAWTIQLTATPRDAAGNAITGLTPTWSTSAPAVASVNAQGVVTGLSPGLAPITAAFGNVTGTLNLTVQQAPVASVTVTPNPASVRVNQTVQLTANLIDARGNPLTGRPVSWSSNSARATVNANGLVTGKQATGTTPVVITATSGGVPGQSQVTVNP